MLYQYSNNSAQSPVPLLHYFSGIHGSFLRFGLFLEELNRKKNEAGLSQSVTKMKSRSAPTWSERIVLFFNFEFLPGTEAYAVYVAVTDPNRSLRLSAEPYIPAETNTVRFTSVKFGHASTARA